MDAYVEINGIEIPLQKEDDCFTWELALVTNEHVYYTQDEGYDIALMYRMRFGELLMISNNYFAYCGMWDDIEDIVRGNIKPLFVSGELAKVLSTLTMEGLDDE